MIRGTNMANNPYHVSLRDAAVVRELPNVLTLLAKGTRQAVGFVDGHFTCSLPIRARADNWGDRLHIEIEIAHGDPAARQVWHYWGGTADALPLLEHGFVPTS